jgi:hypothetical protein
MHSSQDNLTKNYLFISDFDQTLSFNDSGLVLSELIGVRGFTERIAELSDTHLVPAGRRARLPFASRR